MKIRAPFPFSELTGEIVLNRASWLRISSAFKMDLEENCSNSELPERMSRIAGGFTFQTVLINLSYSILRFV